MITDVICEDARWDEAGLEALAERAAQATLGYLDYADAEFEVAILGCDDARISVLNADFREKDKATNVLSWPSDERGADEAGGSPLPPEGPDPELGDIAISFDTCLREADEAGKKFPDHVTHLIVHGILHLLGYDHIDEKDAALMEGLETKILGNLGIADPYII